MKDSAYWKAYRLKNLDKLRTRERARNKRRWAARAVRPAPAPVQAPSTVQAVQASGVVLMPDRRAGLVQQAARAMQGVGVVETVQAAEPAPILHRCQADGCKRQDGARTIVRGCGAYLCAAHWEQRDR